MVRTNYFLHSLLFIAALAGFLIHPVFFASSIPWEAAFLAACCLPLGLYASFSLKTDGKKAAALALFFAGLVFLSWGQYVFSFFIQKLKPQAVLLMLCGMALFACAVYLITDEVLKSASKNPGRAAAWEIWAVSALFVFALAIRFAYLGTLPAGVWFDEAQNGNEVRAILEGKLPGVFITRFTQMPAMFFYLAAPFAHIFGADISGIRAVSALLGALSIPAFYFLLRLIFKDPATALAGALLLCCSRWHITFSRVAFLGMQTLLLEIIFLYLYLKAMEKGSKIAAAAGGVTLGLLAYTFSAAYFVFIFTALHLAYSAVKGLPDFLRKKALTAAVMAGSAFIVCLPILSYAAANKEDFSRRARDVSVMNDIKREKSAAPLFKNIKAYLLMFNFEGDYNGRHNLYKKPMLDNASGIMLAAGAAAALVLAPLGFFAVLLLVMLSAGIATITIEAPQAYRVIGVIPAVYVLITGALFVSGRVLSALSGKRLYYFILIGVFSVSVSAVNLYNYFGLYPKDRAAYMSFSPEANEIASLIMKEGGRYYSLISRAHGLYGFHGWEQTIILRFKLKKDYEYAFMTDNTAVGRGSLAEKEGLLVITRPVEAALNDILGRNYPRARKEEHYHKTDSHVSFYAWYIDKADVLTEGRGQKPVIYLKQEN